MVHVKLSVRSYGRFLDAVSPKSFAFAVLKNGVIVENEDTGGREVEIACGYNQARRLLARAAHVCPEAASEILTNSQVDFR